MTCTDHLRYVLALEYSILSHDVCSVRQQSSLYSRFTTCCRTAQFLQHMNVMVSVWCEMYEFIIKQEYYMMIVCVQQEIRYLCIPIQACFLPDLPGGGRLARHSPSRFLVWSGKVSCCLHVCVSRNIPTLVYCLTALILLIAILGCTHSLFRGCWVNLIYTNVCLVTQRKP